MKLNEAEEGIVQDKAKDAENFLSQLRQNYGVQCYAYCQAVKSAAVF